jgi:hypothetical protein
LRGQGDGSVDPLSKPLVFRALALFQIDTLHIDTAALAISL